MYAYFRAPLFEYSFHWYSMSRLGLDILHLGDSPSCPSSDEHEMEWEEIWTFCIGLLNYFHTWFPIWVWNMLTIQCSGPNLLKSQLPKLHCKSHQQIMHCVGKRCRRILEFFLLVKEMFTWAETFSPPPLILPVPRRHFCSKPICSCLSDVIFHDAKGPLNQFNSDLMTLIAHAKSSKTCRMHRNVVHFANAFLSAPC